MKLTFEKTKLIKETEEIDLYFPMFLFYDETKQQIIKIEIINQSENEFTLNLITISNYFGSEKYITNKTEVCYMNKLSSEIEQIIKDYEVPASEKEFQEMKNETLKEIFNN